MIMKDNFSNITTVKRRKRNMENTNSEGQKINSW